MAHNQQEGIDFHPDGTVTFVFSQEAARKSDPESLEYYRDSTTTYTKGESAIVYRTDVRRTNEYKHRTPAYGAQDGIKIDSSKYKLDGDVLYLEDKMLYRKR